MVWFPPLRCRGVCAKRLSLICRAGYRIAASDVASAVLSGVHESLLQRADCAEDSPPYSKTAIGLVGFEPMTWRRGNRSTVTCRTHLSPGRFYSVARIQPLIASRKAFAFDERPRHSCFGAFDSSAL